MSDSVAPDSTETVAGPRMRVPMIIVALHLAVTFGVVNFGSTNMQNIVGLALAPLLSAFLLIIWWMRSSKVPKKDRAVGLALFLSLIVGITALHGSNGIYLLVVALPVLTTLIVLELLLTTRFSWPKRRSFVVLAMVAWTVGFALIRVDAVGGDLVPVMSWRWNAPMEHDFSGSVVLASQPPAEPIELPAVLDAEDWPEFRGTSRDGRAYVAEFATDWSTTGPEEVWRREVGLGWSSFTVVGDYIFTQEQRGEGEFVVCYRADTGEQVWTNYVHARFEETMGSGPRATPTYVDGKLYTQGATGVLQCLDAATGETLWESNVGDDTGAKLPQWGFASSPLVTDDKVVVFTGASGGKSVIAYDRATGDEAWTSGDGSHGYCSGQLADLAGVSQILMNSNYGIQSYDPETGVMLWEHPWDLGTFARIVQPLLPGNDTVFVGSGFGDGSRLLKVTHEGDSWNVSEEWTTKRFRPYFNDCVAHEGFLYGYDGNRIICVDAATGEQRWKGNRVGGQVLMLPDMDMILNITEKGEVVLFEASPDAYTEVARYQALTGKTWNHPVVAHGNLYVRNSEEAVCLKLPV